MVATQKQNTWQEKLVEASKLRGQSGLAAYRRILLLNEVFNDVAWRDRVGLSDDDKAMRTLDEYVDDLALTFAELRAMLDFYPSKEVWGTGKLMSLYREMREAQAAASRLDGDERPQHKRIKKADFEKLAEEKQQVEYKVKQLTETVQQERDEIIQLRRENASLREELAEARGRIKQLEKAVSRDLAAA